MPATLPSGRSQAAIVLAVGKDKPDGGVTPSLTAAARDGVKLAQAGTEERRSAELRNWGL